MGCQIFVKLRQMTVSELKPIRINTNDPKNWTLIQGRHLCPLFTSNIEKTFIERLEAHQLFIENITQGIEIFIITGELYGDSKIYPKGTWLRLPQQSNLQLQATAFGAIIYVKSGHLQHAINVWGNDA